MKKILIICHYAQQPPLNTMLRYHNWGKELTHRGYKVTIIAASTVHNTDIDIIEETSRKKDVCDGVRYYYIKTPKYTGNGIQRIKNMLSFCLGLRYFRNLNPDMIITCEAYLYPFVNHYFKGVSIITDTVDLWPESIVEYANFSRNNPLIRTLYGLEKKAYLKSDALIFSMEGGKDYVREQPYSKKINYSKVFHINMGCDILQKDKELEGISFNLGWNPDNFNIVYCGSIRQANQVQQICDAAWEIQKRGYDTIRFQIYGNGDDLEMLKKYVTENGINNVSFYGRIEKDRIPYILANGRANILTYKHVPLMKYGGSQSKLFDYLASGRPIICNAKFGYNLIERYRCGVVAENQSAGALADAIEKLYQVDVTELSEMGIRARQAAEAYDQPVLVDKLEEVFKYVIENKNGACI
nr:glycosyltransferase family 4 protein [uncultured Butyrivibrio sp.]